MLVIVGTIPFQIEFKISADALRYGCKSEKLWIVQYKQ